MSFFFTKQKAKAVARGKPATKFANAGQPHKDMLNRVGCKACPLDKANNCTPKMPADLGETGGIYILGDSPTEIGDERGTHFSGAGRKLLDGLIRNSDRCSFDNVVRDYDHYKEQPEWVAMECCRALVTADIGRAKPRLIIGLGILPLQWMLNSSDMVGLRGRVFAVTVGGHACWFMPTYHPNFIVANAYEGSDPLRSRLGHCLKFDIAKAEKLAFELPTPSIDTPQQVRAAIQAFNGHGSGQLAQLKTLISEARKAPEKAIDLETNGLRPYAAGSLVLTCAISFGKTNFAFAIDHPKSGFSIAERKELKQLLRKLLSDETRLIAHNAAFEIEWLIHLLGRDAVFHDAWDCTMVQSHVLDERRGKRGGNDEQFQPNPYQALDFLVKQHFGISYKSVFKIDRKNMAAADLDETLLYNGADTKYTLRLYSSQSKRLKSLGLWDVYQETVPRQVACALMGSIGFPTDQKLTKELQVTLDTEIKKIEQKITALPEVQKFVKDRGAFNPGSTPDVLMMFKNYLKVGAQLLNDEGKERTDKHTLSKIKHPLPALIENFRNKSKMKSTYVDVYEFGKGKYIYPDARVHPNFNTTFTETARLACDSPNAQNWPSRSKIDKQLRKQIVPPKGHVLVAFDYAQLEGCTAAICSRDKTFVKSLWDDYDIHMEWAQRTAKLWPAYIGGAHNYDDKAVMKDFRSLIKNKLVFPAIFGAAKESIAGYLTNATGVEAPKHIVEKLFNDFWRYFSGVAVWQKQIMSTYYETGYVESPTGRRHHYPLTKSQAVNYPIQSVACDVVCRAMVDLSSYAAESNTWHLHPIMNIHDDLTFAIPDDPKILEESIEKIYRTMLAPVYPFINVPLAVSCSVGDNWLEMQEIGKFWSHKDL